jgi:hypothetical protein
VYTFRGKLRLFSFLVLVWRGLLTVQFEIPRTQDEDLQNAVKRRWAVRDRERKAHALPARRSSKLLGHLYGILECLVFQSYPDPAPLGILEGDPTRPRTASSVVLRLVRDQLLKRDRVCADRVVGNVPAQRHIVLVHRELHRVVDGITDEQAQLLLKGWV